MQSRKLLLTFVAILAPARLFADGGTVQLRKEAGALLITVFTSPSPLSAGPPISVCCCRSGMGLIRYWMPMSLCGSDQTRRTPKSRKSTPGRPGSRRRTSSFMPLP